MDMIYNTIMDVQQIKIILLVFESAENLIETNISLNNDIALKFLQNATELYLKYLYITAEVPLK